jgi:hypothetical protein
VRVAIGALGGAGQRQTGLANAARPTQCEQPAGRVVQQHAELGQLGRSADERRGWMWQSRRLGSGRAQAWELGRQACCHHLENLLGVGQIFEAVCAQVAQRDIRR